MARCADHDRSSQPICSWPSFFGCPYCAMTIDFDSVANRKVPGDRPSAASPCFMQCSTANTAPSLQGFAVFWCDLHSMWGRLLAKRGNTPCLTATSGRADPDCHRRPRLQVPQPPLQSTRQLLCSPDGQRLQVEGRMHQVVQRGARVVSRDEVGHQNSEGL